MRTGTKALLILLLFPMAALNAESDPLLFVAHRGASYLAPENTLASMELAWELGAGAAECDVMLTADNQVILFHDKNTRKLTGTPHPVSDTEWSVLRELEIRPQDTHLPRYRGEGIPLLQEVLATVPEDRMLVIEIKTGPEILPHLSEVIDQHWKTGRISFIAFDFRTIAAVKQRYPEVPCYYLSAFRRDALKRISDAVDAGLDGLDLRHSIIDEELSRRCREAGLDLWCWTVNEPAQALRMKELGVSALTTDRPAWLKEQLEANRRD